MASAAPDGRAAHDAHQRGDRHVALLDERDVGAGRGIGPTLDLDLEVALRHVGRRHPHLTGGRELGLAHAEQLGERRGSAR